MHFLRDKNDITRNAHCIKPNVVRNTPRNPTCFTEVDLAIIIVDQIIIQKDLCVGQRPLVPQTTSPPAAASELSAMQGSGSCGATKRRSDDGWRTGPGEEKNQNPQGKPKSAVKIIVWAKPRRRIQPPNRTRLRWPLKGLG